MELQCINEIKDRAPNIIYKNKKYQDFERRRDLPEYLRENLPDQTIYLVRKTLYRFNCGFIPDKVFFNEEIKEKYNQLLLRKEARKQRIKKKNQVKSEHPEEQVLMDYQHKQIKQIQNEQRGVSSEWKYMKQVGDKSCNLTFNLVDKLQNLEIRKHSVGEMSNRFQNVKNQIIEKKFELQSHELNTRILNSSIESKGQRVDLSLDLTQVLELTKETAENTHTEGAFKMPIFSANLANRNILISNYLNPSGGNTEQITKGVTREVSTNPNSSRQYYNTRTNRCSTAKKSQRFQNFEAESKTINFQRQNIGRSPGDRSMSNLFRPSSSASSITRRRRGVDVTLDDLTKSFEEIKQEVTTINPQNPYFYQTPQPDHVIILEQTKQKLKKKHRDVEEEKKYKMKKYEQEERERLLNEIHERNLIQQSYTQIVSRNLIETNLNKKLGLPSSNQPPTFNKKLFFDHKKYDKVMVKLNKSNLL